MGGSKKRKAAKKKKAIEEPNNLVIVQQQQNNENDEVEEKKEGVTDTEGTQQQLRGGELERRDDELQPVVDHSNATTGTEGGGDGVVDIEEIEVEAVEESNEGDYQNQCVVLDATADSLVIPTSGVDYSLVDTAAAVSHTKTITSSKVEQAASPAPIIDHLVQNTPETFHKQPLVGAPVPPRLVMDQKSSWLGCCGMFDLLRGGR